MVFEKAPKLFLDTLENVELFLKLFLCIFYYVPKFPDIVFRLLPEKLYKTCGLVGTPAVVPGLDSL